MIYDKVQIPVSQELTQMSKSDLREFYEWFTCNMSRRVVCLERAVTTTPGYENWIADFSPESLDSLGNWFASVAESRPLTMAEIEERKQRAPMLLDFSKDHITSLTLAIAFDVGIYLGMVFSNNLGSLRWSQKFGSKGSVDYGQPVLEGFGKAIFNPLRTAHVLAMQLAEGSHDGSRLKSIYEHWRGYVLPED